MGNGQRLFSFQSHIFSAAFSCRKPFWQAPTPTTLGPAGSSLPPPQLRFLGAGCSVAAKIVARLSAATNRGESPAGAYKWHVCTCTQRSAAVLAASCQVSSLTECHALHLTGGTLSRSLGAAFRCSFALLALFLFECVHLITLFVVQMHSNSVYRGWIPLCPSG